MHCAGGGFRAEQVSRADLDTGCAERHSRRNAFRIRDATRSNHRQLYRLHNLPQQRESADLSR